mmetsp:Transcript_75010/g.219602  ORF Transcript_75010/g.219602 Transcript_75010/m.219602 type:complete len:344 (+) Transcript_75010:236-1267(+)
MEVLPWRLSERRPPGEVRLLPLLLRLLRLLRHAGHHRVVLLIHRSAVRAASRRGGDTRAVLYHPHGVPLLHGAGVVHGHGGVLVGRGRGQGARVLLLHRPGRQGGHHAGLASLGEALLVRRLRHAEVVLLLHARLGAHGAAVDAARRGALHHGADRRAVARHRHRDHAVGHRRALAHGDRAVVAAGERRHARGAAQGLVREVRPARGAPHGAAERRGGGRGVIEAGGIEGRDGQGAAPLAPAALAVRRGGVGRPAAVRSRAALAPAELARGALALVAGAGPLDTVVLVELRDSLRGVALVAGALVQPGQDGVGDGAGAHAHLHHLLEQPDAGRNVTRLHAAVH